MFELNEGQKNRIQIVRAVAIFMVIIIHTVIYNQYEIYVRPFVNVSVALFIFLSGFLTSENVWGKEVLAFYKRRLLRVFIPYTIWSIVYVVFTRSYSTAIKDFFTGNCCSIYYYIFVYMQLVLITPLVGKLVQSRLKWIGFLITPVAIIVEYIIAWQGIVVPYPYNINNLFVWFIFFYLGMVLRINYKNGCDNVTSKYGLMWIIGIVVIVIELLESGFWQFLSRSDIAGSQIKLSSMLTGIVACFLVYNYVCMLRDKEANQSDLFHKIIIQIGNCSFGIYLIHQLLIMIWGRFLPDLMINNDWWFVVEGIILLIVGTIIVSLMQLIFRKKIGRYLGVY